MLNFNFFKFFGFGCFNTFYSNRDSNNKMIKNTCIYYNYVTTLIDIIAVDPKLVVRHDIFFELYEFTF